jgi:PleD family two-component response regulator
MKEQDIRILVVDDEESIRTVIVQVLEGEGYRVAAAASGEEAYDLFDENPFDLVITDIKMPKMSGIDLLVKVKDRNPDTEVVIITSNASLESAVSALKHGAYDYLMKPFEDIDLIAAVAKRASQKIRLVIENRTLLKSLKQNAAELEHANTTLHQLVIRDALTGAFNHRYFQEALSQELIRSERHGRPCSLIFFDVDDFKWYNDTCGHPWGDEVLRTLAKTAQERLRRSDLLARYGGEEFVVILPETPRSAPMSNNTLSPAAMSWNGGR